MSVAVENGQRIGLGQVVLEANGVQGHDFVSGSFLSGDHTQPYPFPKGDIYLNKLAARVATDDSQVVVTKMLPGERQYLRDIGVIPEGAQIIEVTPTITDESRPGYPATDPIAILGKSDGFEKNGFHKDFDEDDVRPVTVFDNPYIRRDVEQLGFTALNRPDSTITNNKALFREAAEKYGIKMVSGSIVGNEEELAAAVAKYQGKKVWLKVETGSGGDLVKDVDDLSLDNIHEGIAAMRKSVWHALDKGEFDMPGHELWPEDQVAPVGQRIVIELDAGHDGYKLLRNGSNHFVVDKNGNDQILNYFQQLTTPHGEFLGSKTFHPDPELRAMLDDQTERVMRMCREEYGFYGIAGMDYFVVESPTGEREVLVSELNARPIISSYPDIVTRNLQATQPDVYGIPDLEWINTNLVADIGFTSIEDYYDKVGFDLAQGIKDEEGKIIAQVIPLAFRSEYTRTNGTVELEPSGGFKALIVARGEEGCMQVIDRLQANGVRPAA